MSVTFDCPKCKHVETRVVDSRAGANFYGVKRRRRCGQCDHRFNTREISENHPVFQALEREEKMKATMKKLRIVLREPQP